MERHASPNEKSPSSSHSHTQTQGKSLIQIDREKKEIRTLKARFLIAVDVEHVLPDKTLFRDVSADSGALPKPPRHSCAEDGDECESSPERAVDNDHRVVAGQVEADATGSDGESLEQLGDGNDADDGTGRRGVGSRVEDEKQDEDLGGAGESGLGEHGDCVEDCGDHGRASCGVDGESEKRDSDIENREDR